MLFFFSSRRRHTSWNCDWSSDVCSSDLKSAPREGPALLQGLVLCGVCGKRMTVRYHDRDGCRVPDYVCQRDGIERGERFCQSIKGEPIDKSVSDLLLQTMISMARVHVRFKGGVVKTLTLPLPLSAPQLRKTDEAVVQEIDRLLDHHTEREIAAIFNRRGLRSGTGKLFHRGIIVRIRRAYHLKDRFTRL